MTKAQARERQMEAALRAVTEKPGITAYTVSLSVPAEQPGASPGVPAVPAPMTLVLSLLAGLEKAGKVRMERDPDGSRWYPAGDGSVG